MAQPTLLALFHTDNVISGYFKEFAGVPVEIFGVVASAKYGPLMKIQVRPCYFP